MENSSEAALRNIFDQYSQPENRITHALLTALDQDRALLRSFLRDVLQVKPPRAPEKLSLLEQRYPGEEEAAEAELERRGIPDGWIFDDEGWCILIETKVLAALRTSQIESHLRTAERRGFRTITAVAISPRFATALPERTVGLEWRRIYAWLRKNDESIWARTVAEYLEIAEAKLIEGQQLKEGTLTMFAGFPFGKDHPYTYLEGKRLLGLARNELKGRRRLRAELGMNPNVPGRSAITGKAADAVWDFLSLSDAPDAANFTKYPHLTLGVLRTGVEAMVTVPNSINTTMRRNLRSLGSTGFRELTATIIRNLEPLLTGHQGVVPWFRGVQRRYPSQRSMPHLDARIEFDLRTAVPGSGGPKAQPLWLTAAYEAFLSKAGANYQMQMGVIFSPDRCAAMKSPAALDLIEAAWKACKPLVELSR